MELFGRFKRNPGSLRKKIIGPQIILLFIQLAIILSCISGLGLLRNARDNEFDKLAASVQSRALQVQKYFNNISINAGYASDKIQNSMQDILSEKRLESADELLQNQGLVEAFEKDSLPALVNALEYSETSGVFIVLDTNNNPGTKAALYLRDTRPETVSASDLLYVRGPYSIARDLSIPLDSDWSFEQKFTGSESDYYVNPWNAALNKKTDISDQCGYWSGAYQFSETGQRIISYTLPLLDPNGKPFGVFGFEVNEDLLIKKLPSDEIPYQNGFYALYKSADPGSLSDSTVFSGAYASILKGDPVSIRPAGYGTPALIQLAVDRDHPPMLGIKNILELYSPGSCFAGDQWILAGIVPESQLLSLWYGIIQVLAIAFILSFAIGLAGIFGSGWAFARPIAALAKKVRAANPKEPIALGKTNIVEIDDLTAALEKMSSDVAQAASRMSKIIGLVGLPLGGYEADFQNGIAYLTDSMFDLFGLHKEKSGSNTLPLSEWKALLTGILNDKEEGFEDVYRYNPSPKNVRWLRIKTAVISPQIELGIVLDVSEEVLHQRQNEFARDYDSLTGFMNRKAFLNKCTELIEADPSASGILLLADLYFIRSLHASGELENETLLRIAGLFGEFRQFGGILSRISGYEFVVYIHGCGDAPGIMEFAQKQFGSPLAIRRMDGQIQEFFFSIGACRYPEDARNVEDLIYFADFAQNEAQRQPRKGIVPFQMENYNQNNIMAQKNNAFYEILSLRQLNINLIPIMDVNTGNIMGYDALVDYRNSFIKKAEDMIAMARIHNRLFELERLTMISILEYIRENYHELNGAKVFFSSLTNEVIPQSEIQKVDKIYGALYSSIVFNLTDTEHCDKQIFIDKNRELKKRGVAIAIDRYGTVNASELLLLDLKPGYLRMDPSIIQDVNLDPNRHQLLQALLSYTTTRGIRTMAVGIRTREELETVIKMGIDYVQGPYLCEPMSGIILPESTAAQNIRIKIKDVENYKFTLSDGDERYARLLKLLPAGSQLTEREKMILHQICMGELNNVISSDLGISVNTLKTHIRNIYSKCGVKNRKELLMLSESGESPDSELTLREKEILRLIILGKTNQEITSALCISNNTVRVHIWNICTKLGVKNRNDLMEIRL